MDWSWIFLVFASAPIEGRQAGKVFVKHAHPYDIGEWLFFSPSVDLCFKFIFWGDRMEDIVFCLGENTGNTVAFFFSLFPIRSKKLQEIRH